jgi:hypothetical protein
MADAFFSLRHVARRRGLRLFDRDDAVLVCVSLTYSPLTQSATFLTALGRDLNEPKTRRRHVMNRPGVVGDSDCNSASPP